MHNLWVFGKMRRLLDVNIKKFSKVFIRINNKIDIHPLKIHSDSKIVDVASSFSLMYCLFITHIPSLSIDITFV